MKQTFTGVVQYANGTPARGVQVRLFDKDIRGNDDDLTVEAGHSGADGTFTITYDKARDLDFADIYLPYLQFDYPFRGQPQTERKFVQPYERVYSLPHIPPVAFVPSKHGFQFKNLFAGYWLPFSIPSIPDIPSVSKSYGLCGGMCATAYDFMLANVPIPDSQRRPGRITLLHQYLHRRQVDSLGALGKQVLRFVRWMALPDEAVQLRTAVEIQTLRQNLEWGTPTPIGLVYVSSQESWQVWQNHQVLACNYREKQGEIRIQIYDPNYPRRDDVFIRCWPSDHGGYKSEQLIGAGRKPVRGFFLMPYQPIQPPSNLLESLLLR